MSQNKNKKNENKSNFLKFKPNAYWLYGAIFIGLLAFQFFNSGDLVSKNISKNEFFKILNDNVISKITVLNNAKAQFFIK